MTDEKKLYRVEVCFAYYALAPSEAGAKELLSQALRDTHFDEIDGLFTTEVKYRATQVTWPETARPFDDIGATATPTLQEILAKLPTREEASEVDE